VKKMHHVNYIVHVLTRTRTVTWWWCSVWPVVWSKN